MQLATLGSVTLINEYINVSLSFEVLRQSVLDLLDVIIIIWMILTSEFVYERTQEPGRICVQFGYQIVATLGTGNMVSEDVYLNEETGEIIAIPDDEEKSPEV